MTLHFLTMLHCNPDSKAVVVILYCATILLLTPRGSLPIEKGKKTTL